MEETAWGFGLHTSRMYLRRGSSLTLTRPWEGGAGSGGMWCMVGEKDHDTNEYGLGI